MVSLCSPDSPFPSCIAFLSCGGVAEAVFMSLKSLKAMACLRFGVRS